MVNRSIGRTESTRKKQRDAETTEGSRVTFPYKMCPKRFLFFLLRVT